MNGAPIYWLSSRQTLPAINSSEAEIIGGLDGWRHTEYLRIMLRSIGLLQQTTRHMVDNHNAIRFWTQYRVSPRNHHIGTKYERVRYHHEAKEIRITYCHTGYMLADIATKALPQPAFTFLQDEITHIFPGNV